MTVYEHPNTQHPTPARRWARDLPAVLLLLTAPLAACGGDSGTNVTQPPPPPTAGAITITTSTTGAEPDADGYTVAVDGGAAQTIGATGSLTLPSLSVGSHTVTLGGVAGYCAVNGDSAQTVNVAASDTVTAAFTVDCIDGTLLFQSNRQGIDGDTNYEVYAIKPDGSDLRQLTITQGFDNEMPRWSPDGSKIAFMSTRDGNAEIYVMNANGSGVTRLTNDPGNDEYPSWSPDGKRIVFDCDTSGTPNIYTMDASDGGNVEALTADTMTNVWPVWSPDGTRIAFMRDTTGNAKYNIVVMDNGGNNRRQLTNETGLAGSPAWSPDGTQIAFAIEVPAGSLNIFTMGSDGSGRLQLTHATDQTLGPSWSPGGGRLAYSVNGDVYVMNKDGSKQTYITTGSVSAAGVKGFVDWGRGTISDIPADRVRAPGGR